MKDLMETLGEIQMNSRYNLDIISRENKYVFRFKNAYVQLPNVAIYNSSIENLIKYIDHEITYVIENTFTDSYNLKWTLKDENGLTWVERHPNISLSDYEVIYGNNVHEIIKMSMRLVADGETKQIHSESYFK